MTKDKWLKFLKIFGIVVLSILLVFVIIIAGIFTYIAYTRWAKDMQETMSSGETHIFVPEKVEEPVVTCLFLGVKGNLTDFIMLGQYNPNNREIDLLSIPRDTYVGKKSTDGKINSAKSSKGLESLKETVTEITGVKIDYYICFETKILRDVVNILGGVTVDVPMNMDYDDPYQNLYIHLKKGTQKLTGAQAEQFVRYRHGYALGDVGRISAQQQFIKAFIAEIMKAENLSKLPEIVKTVIEGTQTDISLDVALGYVDDVVALKMDRINMNTLPGEGKDGINNYGTKSSFFYIDEEKAKTLIDEMFNKKVEYSSGDSGEKIYSGEKETTSSGEELVRVEVLNAGVSSKVINDIVDKLKESNFYVAKIGTYNDSNKTSRVIDYGKGNSRLLNKIKDITSINDSEKSSKESSVSYTIIVGENDLYKY